MSEQVVAISMLLALILAIFLGFPVAFTLMALGVAVGYYAYFDPSRMWREYFRLDETAGSFESVQLWLDGFFNNRIFDLLVNQTFTVMSNDVLTAVPLFLFMGYIVERANIVDRLFSTLFIATRRVPGSMAVAALVTCTLFATATGVVGAVVTLMGLLAFPAMLKARYDVLLRRRGDLRRRNARHPDPAVDHADRLCGDLGRLGRARVCGGTRCRACCWPVSTSCMSSCRAMIQPAARAQSRRTAEQVGDHTLR
jgi:hypothetical protein